MDIGPQYESLFNDVYDAEHIPAIADVPGVLSVTRYERVELTMAINGHVQRVPSDAPTYHALYALEGEEVLSSGEWAAAVEFGRWPTAVRPHTLNRRHMLIKRR
jgi:hypothetical protein